jgi:hypothetical protein
MVAAVTPLTDLEIIAAVGDRLQHELDAFRGIPKKRNAWKQANRQWENWQKFKRLVEAGIPLAGMLVAKPGNEPPLGMLAEVNSTTILVTWEGKNVPEPEQLGNLVPAQLETNGFRAGDRIWVGEPSNTGTLKFFIDGEAVVDFDRGHRGRVELKTLVRCSSQDIESVTHSQRFEPLDWSDEEAQTLISNELIIQKGLQVFYEVGNALREIRDRRLYRKTHSTFEDYVRERWELGYNYANKQVKAASVVDNLKNCTILQFLPEKESHVRPLTALKPHEQVEVWQKVVERAREPSRVKAGLVEQVVREYRSQSYPKTTRTSETGKPHRLQAPTPVGTVAQTEDGTPVEFRVARLQCSSAGEDPAITVDDRPFSFNRTAAPNPQALPKLNYQVGEAVRLTFTGRTQDSDLPPQLDGYWGIVTHVGTFTGQAYLALKNLEVQLLPPEMTKIDPDLQEQLRNLSDRIKALVQRSDIRLSPGTWGVLEALSRSKEPNVFDLQLLKIIEAQYASHEQGQD